MSFEQGISFDIIILYENKWKMGDPLLKKKLNTPSDGNINEPESRI